MPNPQALPIRVGNLATDDATALAQAQPERRREYLQLRRGDFHGSLEERLYGSAGVLRERWSCPVRVRCARPRSFIAFCFTSSETPATWCGVPVDTAAVLEIDRDWELTTQGAFEHHSFAVEAKSLLRAETFLSGCDTEPRHSGNRVLRGPSFEAARAIRSSVAKALEAGDLSPEARAALQSDLVHLAARLRSWGGPAGIPESSSRRRLAVRRVEEYLAAQPHALPSLAELCAIAGVSERTLEYAFRELVGTTPVRYLRLRRLNGVRRELRSGDPESLRVTEVAMRWGFWELGRFASEYRGLFGERPSATLAACSSRARSTSFRSGDSSP